jgi:hypothetical protein
LAQSVLRELVSVAGDVEEHVMVDQPGLANRGDPIAVGDERHAVDRSKLDQRHATAGLLINDVDGKAAGGRPGRG